MALLRYDSLSLYIVSELKLSKKDIARACAVLRKQKYTTRHTSALEPTGHGTYIPRIRYHLISEMTSELNS
eukprot:7784644-Pyramimonas_sp.AAC.1